MSTRADIRPYTKKELASLYELSPRAFYTLFRPHEEEIGKKTGRYYSIKQVELIFIKLGVPGSMLSDGIN